MKLDLLLRNADIITMDPARPVAHLLGIWKGRIVGLDNDVFGLDSLEVLDPEDHRRDILSQALGHRSRI